MIPNRLARRLQLPLVAALCLAVTAAASAAPQQVRYGPRGQNSYRVVPAQRPVSTVAKRPATSPGKPTRVSIHRRPAAAATSHNE